MRRIRLWLNNRKNRFQNAVHNELLYQVKGMITGLIDDYLYLNKICLEWDFEDSNGIDAYIKDDFYGDESIYVYICSLAHLHPDDLLWYILNQEEYNKKIIKNIDEYVKYKKENR